MAECDICGEEESMPYQCRHCGGTYCSDHRLPESHDCPGLENWEQTGAVFDSGFDDQIIQDESQDDSIGAKLGFDTGPGGTLAYFRNNMTYVFLGAMWGVFALQLLLQPFLSEELWTAIFVFSPENPQYVWTWVTSIFAHSSLMHILFNSIVIFFFGRLVEQYIGSKEFGMLFIASGVLAGGGQVLFQILTNLGGEIAGGGVVGASGAALALLGVLTILKPDLTVYLYFFIPMPIWVLTGGTVVVSTLLIIAQGAGAFGIAHVAHLVGALIGLAYGQRVKDRVRLPGQFRFGGGPGRGGPGGPGGPGGRGPF